jgi:prostaglandin-E synthase 1
MNDLMTNPAFKTFALSTVVLAFNLLFLSGFTGAMRARNKVLANPEDAGYSEQKTEHPKVARALRAHRNALENIFPYFALGLVYVLSGATPRGAAVYFGTFTAARLLHTVVYLLEKQPWRTLCFAVGVLCMLGMMVQIVMKVI